MSSFKEASISADTEKGTATKTASENSSLRAGIVEHRENDNNNDNNNNSEAATEKHSNLKRNLGNRQIQLIAIGGSIGTATFVTIGAGLAQAGPAGLLLAYLVQCCFVALANNSMAEMAVLMPVSSAFIRMAGHWVDPALGFLAGWNFFFYEAVNIPFEISAITVVLGFWRDDIPPAAVVAVCIVLYFTVNVFAVQWFGESEFWLATGKIFLTVILFCFTFITMVGGNPQHDAYGFRYWRSPGPFAEYLATGNLGRFQGFLSALWSAVFTIVGPEYVSMLAGEAILPRRNLKSAFRATYGRLIFFFLLSAICVSIVIPYNDPALVDALSSGKGSAATASPYVIAMENMGIHVLPHITTALLITSIFSAGNAYTYYASRSLYGLALEGQAPALLATCTASGVPICCLLVTMIFPCLAFLNVSSSTADVLTWLINLVTSSGIINYTIISVTYLFFYRATRFQGLDRKQLPYYGYGQPYATIAALLYFLAVLGANGYAIFLPGNWDVKGLFTHYTMIFLSPVLYLGWKIIHKTRIITADQADLVWESTAIDEYEQSYEGEISRGSWWEILNIFRCRGLRNRVS
ncbi:amino acid transporter [Beauveria bassiana ARSEF 2860]|uniref:Amino acid transporter n=1 Tax=Beauveria bassiana (strain ARSEF 2860) TaxID=655819 RepID=J4KL80_BEAB2|nr:amino acid transporter [Beauveria bassiana ARSEF 2860]EJP61739.1 amino acid transporter [Beauveria bassiana ARSEF 2860]